MQTPQLWYVNVFVSDLAARGRVLPRHPRACRSSSPDEKFGYASFSPKGVRMGVAPRRGGRAGNRRRMLGRRTGIGFGVPDLDAALPRARRQARALHAAAREAALGRLPGYLRGSRRQHLLPGSAAQRPQRRSAGRTPVGALQRRRAADPQLPARPARHLGHALDAAQRLDPRRRRRRPPSRPASRSASSRAEWLAVVLAIVAVWTAEALNTAFEALLRRRLARFPPARRAREGRGGGRGADQRDRRSRGRPARLRPQAARTRSRDGARAQRASARLPMHPQGALGRIFGAS